MIIFFAIVCTILFVWTLWLLSKSKSYGCGCALVGMAIFAFLMGWDEETGFWEIATIVIIPIAFGLTGGLIYNNREEKRKKAAEEARKAREAGELANTEYRCFELAGVENCLEPESKANTIPCFSKINITANPENVDDKEKYAVNVWIDDYSILGHIPKEEENDVVQWLSEGRVKSGWIPECHYDRKTGETRVTVELGYIKNPSKTFVAPENEMSATIQPDDSNIASDCEYGEGIVAFYVDGIEDCCYDQREELRGISEYSDARLRLDSGNEEISVIIDGKRVGYVPPEYYEEIKGLIETCRIKEVEVSDIQEIAKDEFDIEITVYFHD